MGLPYHRIRTMLLQRRGEPHVLYRHFDNFVRHVGTEVAEVLWKR